MKILTARYVVPVSSAAIENGAIAFENERIAAVGELAEVTGNFP